MVIMPKSKKAKPSNTNTAPSSPDIPSNEVVDTTTPEVNPILEECNAFMASLQELSSRMQQLRTQFKALEKNVSKEMKHAQKLNKKKRNNKARKPSGFVKPTLISKELAAFLGKGKGTEMARTEVTREINKYIREHSLQDKDNGRKINPDKQLKKLLKLKNEELTYFNLQKYMSPHFAKSGVPLTSDFQ